MRSQSHRSAAALAKSRFLNAAKSVEQIGVAEFAMKTSEDSLLNVAAIIVVAQKNFQGMVQFWSWRKGGGALAYPRISFAGFYKRTMWLLDEFGVFSFVR